MTLGLAVARSELIHMAYLYLLPLSATLETWIYTGAPRGILGLDI